MHEFFQAQLSYADTKSSIIASSRRLLVGMYYCCTDRSKLQWRCWTRARRLVVVDTRIATGTGRPVLLNSAFAPEFAA